MLHTVKTPWMGSRAPDMGVTVPSQFATVQRTGANAQTHSLHFGCIKRFTSCPEITGKVLHSNRLPPIVHPIIGKAMTQLPHSGYPWNHDSEHSRIA